MILAGTERGSRIDRKLASVDATRSLTSVPLENRPASWLTIAQSVDIVNWNLVRPFNRRTARTVLVLFLLSRVLLPLRRLELGQRKVRLQARRLGTSPMQIFGGSWDFFLNCRSSKATVANPGLARSLEAFANDENVFFRPR